MSMNISPEYQEVTDTTEVPRHAGVEGFIVAIRSILRQPRVSSISIDNRGKITFTRFARKEEPRKQVEIDFESVAPSAIIRNGHVIELDMDQYHGNAAVCIAAMFARSASDHMFPAAWVVGAQTYLGGWHALSTGVALPDASAFGLPVLRDRHIPDDALLLACAYGPNAALIDAQMAYKISMPSPLPLPRLIETPEEPAPSEEPA